MTLEEKLEALQAQAAAELDEAKHEQLREEYAALYALWLLTR